MPRLRTRPYNRKMKNFSRSSNDANIGDNPKNELSVDLGINKSEQRYFRRKRKSVSRYAIIMLRDILHEEQMYKQLFNDLNHCSVSDEEDVYMNFVEMIGGFEARNRVVENSPFSARPKSKEINRNEEFPELSSLLKTLPNHRFSSHLKNELLLLSEKSRSDVIMKKTSDKVTKDSIIHRTEYTFEIEEYPAYNLKTKCEEDIADVTAGIDLLAIPKSMSSMAEAMYS